MKSSKAPLERKRPLFFLAGLVCALSVTLVSFEWRTPYDFPKIPLGTLEVEEVTYELPPVTTRKVEKPELKVDMPKITQETNEIEIVDNEVEESIDSEDFKIPEDLDDLTFSTDDGPEIDDVDEIETFKIVEEMPAYPGGDLALLKFIGENVEYPQIAKENGITGTVYVSYVVDKDGNVVEVELARGVDHFLDKEALRVVKKLKGYKAGKQRGKPVRVMFTIPIRFELQ